MKTKFKNYLISAIKKVFIYLLLILDIVQCKNIQLLKKININTVTLNLMNKKLKI